MTGLAEREQTYGGRQWLPSRRQWPWRLAGLAVSAIALLIVADSVDLSEAWAVITQADILPLAAALVVVAGQLLVRGSRWSILLPPRPDGSRVSVRRTITPMLVGYLANAILPARLGEPIRAFLVARREQLDTLASFGATILERVVDFTTLALIALVAAIVVGAQWWVAAIGAAAGLGGLLFLGLLVVVGSTRLADFGVVILTRLGLGERTRRLQRWAVSFAGGLDRGRDTPRLLGAVALSSLAWALDALVFWLVAQSLDIDLGYSGAIVVGAVAVLATAIPAAPGYVGTFELAATAAAVAVGASRAEAFALAVLVHVVTVIPIALAGTAAVVTCGTGLGRLAAEAEGRATSQRHQSATL